jgi:hypothetical protein
MDRTEGEYTTEDCAHKHIDQLLATAGELFKVFSEVDGVFSSVRLGHKAVRIDRVLWPLKPLLALGWRHGAVGIEIKKSNHPAGSLVNQASDYVESMWTIPSSGLRFSINSVFIFPAFEYTGALASVMAARRIGHVAQRGGRLMLSLNHSRLLDYWEGSWRVGESPNIKCGMKVGSR